ncbi:hypothetical protein CHS0354_000410 [Potamilus streckersoni]|uniref:Uncharacterized protein n=1 Tax=Potamilus streckersoni TaxID=2493646 RepID=A0AAE0VI46_9BIVA|nr:hypothetical protein CHS0354_000410 [Potamilus streckersoni]
MENGHLKSLEVDVKYSTKEKAAIDKLRAKLSDLVRPETPDSDLWKWLKARQYDVSKAEQMFRAHQLTRKEYRLDNITKEFEEPEVIQKYLTGGFCGYDKDGSPIRVELYGHLDMKGIMASVRKSDLEKSKLLQCEQIVQMWKDQSEKLGRKVEGLTVIFDMEGVSTKMLWRPGLQMYLHLVKVLEDNYPEMMKRLLVTNAPRIFPLLYKLARPLISEDMRNKIFVLGADTKEFLLKHIDADQLPAYLGGTLTDPDGNPRCITMICQGGDVPEKYYLDSSELLQHMQEATIPRGDKILVEFEVGSPGSILRWEFKTEDHDVGFGVLLKDGQKNVPIVPVKRVNSHLVAEDGSIVCDMAGTYLLCFDNTFSWTRSKKIYYLGEVIVSDDDITSEIRNLVSKGDWKTLEEKFETTHL